MRVGSSHAERVDPRSPGSSLRLPRVQLCVDIEGAVGKVYLRVGCLEMQTGWDLFMLQSQHRLDQARGACRAVQMSDIRLDRANGTIAHLIRLSAKRFGERGYFDGIAQFGGGAM